MIIAPDRLNPQALSLEVAQAEIRLAVKDAAFKQTPKAKLDKQVLSIIMKALASVYIPDLKRTAYTSLINFYHTQRRIAEQMTFGNRLLLFLALTKLVEKANNTPKGSTSEYTENMSLREARKIVEATGYYIPEYRNVDDSLNYARTLEKYHEDYIRDNLRPYLDKMAEAEALDPESEKYIEQRSTLRDKAEREVRYKYHLDQIQGFKDEGVKLVMASAHADCSVRCREWQGRVYSLDGTSGITDDGRAYVPLEKATEVPTKNNKWFNGLLGFNCRHYLVKYTPGRAFTTASEAVEEKQYKITQTQRALERGVRRWTAKAEMYKNTDPKEYERAKKKAEWWNYRYEKYSKEHHRAYYPSRVQVL